MHVLSDKKRTTFWIITSVELVGIFIMIGLLVYQKYMAPKRSAALKTNVQAAPPVKKAAVVKRVERPVMPAAPVVKPAEQPKPAALPTPKAEPVAAENSDINEQGDSWQVYTEEAKTNSNSAASGPPLPKVIRNPKIVVTKSKQILEVYDGDKLLRTYLASTGTNPGDKEKSGDRKTPEGEFYVCVKNPKSRFVLSLGLSYPEHEDARRGLREGLISQAEYNHIVSELNMKRQPPWNTKLGGEVMIHGVRQGGRSTAGCIALENDDIREIYPRISVGTKVIVKP